MPRQPVDRRLTLRGSGRAKVVCGDFKVICRRCTLPLALYRHRLKAFMRDSAAIRRAVVADAEAISEVHLTSKQAAYAGLVPESVLSELSTPQAHAERKERWRKILENNEIDVFVVELDGQVIGFASSGNTQDNDGDQKAMGEVYAIYVSPNQQRSGIGRKQKC